MRFAPRWLDPAVRAEAAAAFRATGNLRLDGVLADDAVAALHAAVRELGHPLIAAAAPDFAYQYGAYVAAPDATCDHAWCQFGRWWWTEGAALASEVTGMTLRPPRDRRIMTTLMQRGGFLDPHNDVDGQRRCAYVLGLSPAPWPAEDGGHLEFLAVEDGRVVVTERRPPGWNTLDLFDVRGAGVLHQVPIITADVERRAVTGWWF